MRMKAYLSNQWGHICISMRGPEVDSLLPDLEGVLETAEEEGVSSVEIEVEISDRKIEILRIIGPGEP